MWSFTKPELSIIVIAFNMQREVPRTLLSLSRNYQRDLQGMSYEVLVIDNNSSHPLDEKLVKSFGKEFIYHYFKTDSVSPVEAINYGVERSRSPRIMINIDGARILSPGLLSNTMKAYNSYVSPFVYTLSWHLGNEIQNESITKGYNQEVEDKNLAESGWEVDGYNLFNISTLAASSKGGFFKPIAESNCYSLSKRDYYALGGLDARFQTKGGGLVNLDFFKSALQSSFLHPVMLLGEGTFHQVHGGVATNVTMENHPMKEFQEEYLKIRGGYMEFNINVRPSYIGSFAPQAERFISPE